MLNNDSLKCPRCQSSEYRKNGKVNNKQRYRCKNCGRQFSDTSAYAVTIKATSALLLDAENIKLDQKIETFLSSLTPYPLQVKIAFANWRITSLSRRDLELHERGYQLIHVPEGKDSADGKMIAVGASIFLQYPEVKTMFICSSDWIFSHLCTELQNRGLTVFWVRRENNLLRIENKETGMVNDYAIELNTEIPSFTGFVDKFQEIIEAEHESINQRLERLENVASLFQIRCNLDGKNNQSNNKIKEAEKVSLIQQFTPNIVENAADNQSIKNINSYNELETAIVDILQFFKQRYPLEKITVSQLSVEFQKICRETLTQIVTRLRVAKNGTKFLLSNPKFKLQPKGVTYEVTLVEDDGLDDSSDDSLDNSEIVTPTTSEQATLIQPNYPNFSANNLENSTAKTINSADELETAIIEILRAFKKHSPLGKITITQLSVELKKIAGESLNQIVSRLKLASSSSKFLLSNPKFQLNHNEVFLEGDDIKNISDIFSPDALEQVLITIVKKLMKTTQQQKIPLTELALEFQRIYRKPVSKVIKKLTSDKKLIVFLQGCTGIKVEQVHKKHYVRAR